MMDSNSIIKIIVVSEFQLFRNALTFPFIDNNDFLVVGQADNYSNLLIECKKKKPDIILLYYSSSIHDSLFVTKKIKESFSSVKTIIFTKNGNQESLYYSIRAGAFGLLSVDVNKDELIHAVRK
jgi:DNA-binding NarL/FixJ family response regulator